MDRKFTAKKDCFAYKLTNKNGILNEKCKALKEMYCRREECKFYKPKGTECDSCKNYKLKIKSELHCVYGSGCKRFYDEKYSL